ncbi:hypothetical protein CQA38_06195 [Campylobacter sp. MIT 12-5580]|uniref:ABC transporter ATP-binding protein n=1 Tax=Campylobacter sp. MIT 12-5580 TaxID=2040651 RepID=UPI0010F8164B|nr:ABC transporter ATP-binding protein [Campylobacter sp. MIT 12-5580]TKX28738.1 hypothetical protein CQA38_06195 [Campylobacter sp. MIT 12-5580]
MSIFRVENASFARFKRVLFKELSFELEKGEILAILGQNGVGKTTLLQCLMGLLNLQEGKVFIKDKDISTYRSKELFSILSYVAQAKNHSIGLSALDMVLLGLNTQISTLPKKAHIQKARAMLENLGFLHLENRACDSLSGGELQMVVFARALINEPQIIILDEPESNLDFKNQLCIIENLNKLKAMGKTIIFNTHYPQNAKVLADKVLILEKHEHHIGDNTLINKKQLAQSFEVKEQFFDYLLL